MRRWIVISSLLVLPALAAWVKLPETADQGSPKTNVVSSEKAIVGMWSRFQPEKEGDPQRFYYFHAGGIGLFRYGKMGLTYTQTFRYDVDSKAIRLTFNKDKAKFAVPYRLEGGVLTLLRDPVMGGKQAYIKRGTAAGASDFGPSEHPLARMWTQSTPDGKGGAGFRMYQFQAPTIDGRGVGWYHEGDFAEWSTETLQYRRTGDRLSLTFPVRGEGYVTNVSEGKDKKARTLHLEQDPRNFWHPRTYTDGGPSFTMMVAGAPLPFYVPGHGPARGCGYHR